MIAIPASAWRSQDTYEKMMHGTTIMGLDIAIKLIYFKALQSEEKSFKEICQGTKKSTK